MTLSTLTESSDRLGRIAGSGHGARVHLPSGLLGREGGLMNAPASAHRGVLVRRNRGGLPAALTAERIVSARTSSKDGETEESGRGSNCNASPTTSEGGLR